MNPLQRTVILVGTVLLAAILLVSFAPADAAAEARPYCHANSSGGYVYLNNPAWVSHFENNGTPKAGHEGDFLTFEGDTDCVGFSEPTPTATPEPTATPSEDPTEEPTSEPTQEPTATPTPVSVRDCPPVEPCGWFWRLVGPEGQVEWFASFSPRPGMDRTKGTGWYPPNADAQLRCLGWVAVGNLPGRPLYGGEKLVSCQGGRCSPAK